MVLRGKTNEVEKARYVQQQANRYNDPTHQRESKQQDILIKKHNVENNRTFTPPSTELHRQTQLSKDTDLAITTIATF